MPKKHTQSNKIRKRKGKDIDELLHDLKPKELAKLVKQPFDLDLPGGGQHYCVPCGKHFIRKDVLEKHNTSKPHKQRLKALEAEPHTQNEANAAAGMGTYDFSRNSRLPNKRLKLSMAMECSDGTND